ncbi:alpha-amylase family protein [Longivirga aurantiaca]|uniref:Alpha-amylase family protein n=1 Tax=Longivirga aurantiaca TaxID=1837743 RepID=A0ABW1SYG5_9ACTN
MSPVTPSGARADVADLVAAALAARKASTYPGAADLLARARRWGPDLSAGVHAVFGPQSEGLVRRLAEVVVDGWLARPEALRERDVDRLLRPDWFQGPDALGYVCYADRFAGTLAGVTEHVDYLRELGTTYLHLMPLLAPREGANDGGYAVADYRSVRSDLGTMDDLEKLAAVLHDNGIALTIDLVLNHVAAEHEWAAAARAGDPRYRAYFHVFDDRAEPDRFERTLPEVFPDFAPGNFTWDDEIDGWVWTTFNSYQWDLNWSNPDVVTEFADLVLFLANKGVDCLRLDAIAFLWKRLGTNCQNQPEVHGITRALRAVARIAAPSLVFKAEAIVAPGDLVKYLGVGEYAGSVSDLAYHNSLMVQIWSALATNDARLLVRALDSFPPKPTTTAWATYLRCHDDIGWAIDDADAAAIGWNGYDHRRFLSQWFVGAFPGSPARGAEFQVNEATGDSRISGSAASLAGVETALASNDAARLEIALRRLRCAYAVVYGFGGIPLLYMGDELALLNDHSYLDEPAHAEDNRWMHRPKMPWDRVSRRTDPYALEGRMHGVIKHLGEVRRSLPSLHAAVESETALTSNPSVLAVQRRHAAGDLVQLYNFSGDWQRIDDSALGSIRHTDVVDHLTGGTPLREDGQVVLEPYAALWLTTRT